MTDSTYWRTHLINSQKGVEVAKEALKKIDSPQEIAEATMLVIGSLGVNTFRVRAEADFRWLVDNKVDKGLLTHREAYDAIQAYRAYLASPDGIPRGAPPSPLR